MSRHYVSWSMLLLLSFLAAGCASGPSGSSSHDLATATPILLDEKGNAADEVSLRADRAELDKLRGEVPEEVKKQNDEIAMLMSFVVRESEEDPQRLRDRFSTALRKKREAVNKKVSLAREAFSKKEKADRAEFVKESKSQRDAFVKNRKRSSDERRDFFSNQDDKRRAFFADQQERRKDFELQVQDERKSVEDSMREAQNAFNQELRSYQARYTERRKQLDLKKKMEEKSRSLERQGRAVKPVTPAIEVGESTGQISPVSTAPTASQPQASPKDTLNDTFKDALSGFENIPDGPGIPLTPGKKGP